MPLAEKALVARIRRCAGKANGIITGIGDDCAVLRIPTGHEALITTDFSLEGVHFRREWHPPESVGHRCLTRGLSDIAAMGGNPMAAFLSLALPRSCSQKWVDGFMRGLLELARESGVSLAGGDTAESRDGILADIVVLGSVPHGKAILRSGARPGDLVCVTGELGASASTLHLLLKHPKRKLNPDQFSRHFYPQARLAVGKILREKFRASSMIDLSDGLSTDLAHICEESGVGAEIHPEAIPLAAIGKPRRPVDLNSALHGGEDYELLFTVPSQIQVPLSIAGVAIATIGRITRGKKIMLIGNNARAIQLKPGGWQHFAK